MNCSRWPRLRSVHMFSGSLPRVKCPILSRACCGKSHIASQLMYVAHFQRKVSSSLGEFLPVRDPNPGFADHKRLLYHRICGSHSIPGDKSGSSYTERACVHAPVGPNHYKNPLAGLLCTALMPFRDLSRERSPLLEKGNPKCDLPYPQI